MCGFAQAQLTYVYNDTYLVKNSLRAQVKNKEVTREVSYLSEKGKQIENSGQKADAKYYITKEVTEFETYFSFEVQHYKRDIYEFDRIDLFYEDAYALYEQLELLTKYENQGHVTGKIHINQEVSLYSHNQYIWYIQIRANKIRMEIEDIKELKMYLQEGFEKMML